MSEGIYSISEFRDADLFECGDWETYREFWSYVGKQFNVGFRQIDDSEVARLRGKLPFGPPNPKFVVELAHQAKLSPISIFRIWAGSTFRRVKAFPIDHPMRLALNEHNATKQRERAKITPTLIQERGDSQEWRCVYCLCDISEEASPDHIIPLSQGGTSDPDNVQLTCRRCNKSKGALSDADYRVKLNRIQQASYRKDAKAQRLGFDSHEDMVERLNVAFSSAVVPLIWADSQEAQCLWCNGPTKLLGENDYVSEHDSANVFHCVPCNRSFSVTAGASWDFFQMELGWALDGQEWVGEEIVAFVKAVASGDPEKISSSIGVVAGNIIEVKRRRHKHKGDNICWCELGEGPFYAVGDRLEQSNVERFGV